MKKFYFAGLLAVLLTGCTKNDVEEPKNSDLVEMTMYFTRFQFEQEGMTRASSVTDYITRLDIWISDGETTTAYNQATETEGFGSLSLTLNKNKIYTMYAVAHKGSAPATLSDGVVSFQDDKVTHSFFYSETFQPTKDMAKVCPMDRIVAMFMLSTTDAVPEDVKKVRITLGNVFTRWNVAGYGVNAIDKVSTISITSTKPNGTVDLMTYGIVTNENTNHTVLVEALDANEAVLQTQTFENVPLRNGYRTIATGSFFTDAPSSFSFTAEEWMDNTGISF